MTTPEVRSCRLCASPIPEGLAFCSKCGAAVTIRAPGDPLLEKLRVLFGAELEFEQELGRGGMAVVYAAFDPGLQRRVAVKALLPELAAEAGMTERFLREARTVASLQHPHVVTVYAVRASADAQAIVMQYVDGRSLDALLKEQSPLPLHIAGMVLAQTAEGLQHAHDRGVVHRDVKPANVLLDRDGRAVVSDFGIARRDDGPRTTATGLVIGTWAYMSPEQRRGEPTTAATDQYAFGVMAFELLAGRRPFIGTLAEILRGHLLDAPPSLREFRPEVPVGVETLVNRMLAKLPEERLSSLREAQEALRTLVTDRAKTTQILSALSQVREVATAPTRQGGGAAVDASAAPTERLDGASSPTRAAATARPRALKVALATAAAVAVAALGVWAAVRFASRVETATVEGATQPFAPAASAGFDVPGTGGASGTIVAKDAQPRIGAPALSAAARRDSARPVELPVVTQPGGETARPQGAAGAAAGVVAGAAAGAAPAAASSPAPNAASNAAPNVAANVAENATGNAPAGAAAPATAATVADARRIAREFVTMLNQRRYRDVAQLAPVGGDAALRAELVTLTQNAPDFEAGFDRVASAPEATRDGFMTEFTLDLAWRGGKKLLLIQAHATLREAAWHLTGIGIEASP